MIGADTNILARVILDDDETQSPLARQFLEEQSKQGKLYISPYVILELSWLLKSKGLGRHQIVPIIDKIIHADGVTVGHKNVITAALSLYSKQNLSFADCLITMDAHLTVNANTATFDKALRNAEKRAVEPEVNTSKAE